MDEPDIIDLSPLRDTHWAAHADHLADQIAARLGTTPRPLPAPVQLAFEAAAGRVLVAAAVVILIGVASVGLRGPDVAAPPAVTDLILSQPAPSAASVYLALRGMQP